MTQSQSGRSPEALANLRAAMARPEYRAKLSASLKGKKRTPQQCANMSAAQKGKKLTSETRVKLSIAMKGRNTGKKYPGRKLTPAHCVKISSSLKGKKKTPEARTRMSAVKKGKPGKKRTLETRAKISARLTSYKKTPEHCANLSRRTFTLETREKMSVAKKKAWASLSDEEKERRRIEFAERGRRIQRPTSIELTVKSWLDKSGIPYEAEKRLGRYSTDFYVPHLNLVIECHGDYWHRRPGEPEYDAFREQWLRSKGYDVTVLWEKDIKSGSAKTVLMIKLGLIAA